MLGNIQTKKLFRRVTRGGPRANVPLYGWDAMGDTQACPCIPRRHDDCQGGELAVQGNAVYEVESCIQVLELEPWILNCVM